MNRAGRILQSVAASLRRSTSSALRASAFQCRLRIFEDFDLSQQFSFRAVEGQLERFCAKECACIIGGRN
jgi:hypothetical protein